MNLDHNLKKEVISKIKEVYPTLDDQFHAHDLFRRVVSYIAAVHHRHIYPDTCLRYFRDLRLRGEIKCACINRKESIYQKLEL